jgi:hypothetical protein
LEVEGCMVPVVEYMGLVVERCTVDLVALLPYSCLKLGLEICVISRETEHSIKCLIYGYSGCRGFIYL